MTDREVEQFKFSVANVDDESMARVVEFLAKTHDANTYAPYNRPGGDEELRTTLVTTARRRLNEGYCRTNGHLGYIAIPKNASSTLKEVFEGMGWGVFKAVTLKEWETGPTPLEMQNINAGSSFQLTNISYNNDNIAAATFHPDHTQLFAVLREPVSRWISGFTQSFYTGRPEIVDKVMDGDIDGFIEDPWFDMHQAPQFVFLQLWPKVTTFKIEHLDKLKAWLLERGVDIGDPERKNISADFRKKKVLYEKLQALMTPERKEKLNKFYARDLELYEEAI